jgi:hypothetical protein
MLHYTPCTMHIAHIMKDGPFPDVNSTYESKAILSIVTFKVFFLPKKLAIQGTVVGADCLAPPGHNVASIQRVFTGLYVEDQGFCSRWHDLAARQSTLPPLASCLFISVIPCVAIRAS